MVNVLVLYGDGINAHFELKNAFIQNGANAELVHVNQLVSTPAMIHEYDILAFPGGFSFGDEIRSGKVLALKLKKYLSIELIKYIKAQKLIIGICNGFQTLVQLNVFNNFNPEKKFTLTENNHGEFRNFWTEIKILPNNSPWLTGLTGSIYLPVRHKEGRLYGDLINVRRVLQYSDDINGSLLNTAGIVDETGLVFGLMPHPEASLDSELFPLGIDGENAITVNKIFKNAVQYSKNLRGNDASIS